MAQQQVGTAKNYPGDLTTPSDLIALADEYRRAAVVTIGLIKGGMTVSTSPFRLLSIHAIELYLNAFLLAGGETPATIRGMQHSLAARGDLLNKHGLVLRKKTSQHLNALSERREYLVSRYDPTVCAPFQVNRMHATLEEVRGKVLKRLNVPAVEKCLRAATG